MTFDFMSVWDGKDRKCFSVEAGVFALCQGSLCWNLEGSRWLLLISLEVKGQGWGDGSVCKSANCASKKSWIQISNPLMKRRTRPCVPVNPAWGAGEEISQVLSWSVIGSTLEAALLQWSVDVQQMWCRPSRCPALPWAAEEHRHSTEGLGGSRVCTQVRGRLNSEHWKGSNLKLLLTNENMGHHPTAEQISTLRLKEEYYV